MFEHGGLCYLHTADNRIFVVKAASGANHLNALNKFTNTYIESAAFVERILTNDMVKLSQEYPDLAAIVVFSEYTVEQVLQITKAGRVLPAGITRFIIPGRVLRLNADLNILKSDKSLAEKNKWLYDLMVEKLSNREIRYYAEPVYLLDE
jgi:hypothetical protein